MLTLALRSQFCGRESVERKPWTSEDSRAVLVFLAQSLGLVCAAMFLYSLGLALGMMLMVASLAVWSFLKSQIASAEEEDGRGEDSDTVESPSRCADPACTRNSRLAAASVSAARPLILLAVFLAAIATTCGFLHVYHRA